MRRAIKVTIGEFENVEYYSSVKKAVERIPYISNRINAVYRSLLKKGIYIDDKNFITIERININ